MKKLQVFDEDILGVGPMEIDVATDLILKKLESRGREAKTNDIARLVKQL